MEMHVATEGALGSGSYRHQTLAGTLAENIQHAILQGAVALGDTEAGYLAQAHTRVEQEQEDRDVAAADRPAAVDGRQESLHLVLVQRPNNVASVFGSLTRRMGLSWMYHSSASQVNSPFPTWT
jgi:hypothetical protein